MKLFSKITSLLLCVLMLLACASCGNTKSGDVPDGMKNATAAGDDFRLYVPSVWNVNVAYGVSGAYFTMSQQSTVSVVKYAIDRDMQADMTAQAVGEGSARLEWFWQKECIGAVEQLALGGSLSVIGDDSESCLLGDANAIRRHASATVNGQKMHFVHVVAERAEAFYVFSFISAEDLYTSLLENVSLMLDEFRFDEPYLPDDYVKDIDPEAEAPQGMKLASNDDVAYRFYVPEQWIVDRDQEIFAAYLESDRSSVSVVPYMPDVESMSVAQFYRMCEDMMKNTSEEGGYELLKTEKEVDLGGRVATAYTYTYTVGGVKYCYLQVIAAYKSMIYSLTYTALPENFEAHLEEVDRMIDTFEFR